MATTHPLQQLMNLAATFVVDQKGRWNHSDWESFLIKAEALGIRADDETKRNLGNMLEAAKHFHAALPGAAPKKKAAAAKKPAAKKKAAAKK